MTPPLSLPATLTANTPQNVNDLNSNLSAIVTEINAQVPAVRCTNTVAQSVNNTTLTAITFDTETHKTVSGMHSTSSNQSRLIATSAGLYTIAATVGFVANATGTRMISIRLNGTTALTGAGNIRAVNSASEATYLSVTTTYRLAVNDYVEVMMYQSSGGGLNTAVDTSVAGVDVRPRFELEFISP